MFSKILIVAFGLLMAVAAAKPGLAQPAPQLKSVSVAAVLSTGYSRQWDYPRGALVTPQDHSGPELIVVTFDDGYSLSQKATFLGSPMTQYKTEQYPSRGPITGYYRYWYINTPFTSGNFSYESVSIGSVRKFGTSIKIR